MLAARSSFLSGRLYSDFLFVTAFTMNRHMTNASLWGETDFYITWWQLHKRKKTMMVTVLKRTGCGVQFPNSLAPRPASLKNPRAAPLTYSRQFQLEKKRQVHWTAHQVHVHSLVHFTIVLRYRALIDSAVDVHAFTF